MTAALNPTAAGTIRPFHVDIAAEALNDLRGRLARTREPAKELVDDASQGVQLQTIEKLVRYWRCWSRAAAVR